MSETYDDAEPDETVFVSRQGNMSLLAAVRRYLRAREEGTEITLFRDLGKRPGTFDGVDIERLARLKRFRVVGR